MNGSTDDQSPVIFLDRQQCIQWQEACRRCLESQVASVSGYSLAFPILVETVRALLSCNKKLERDTFPDKSSMIPSSDFLRT